jgi:hypothetical protein
MEWHEVWHVVVLTSTLIGAAGAGLLALAPLLFGETPAGLAKARPLVVALVGVAAIVLLVEWLAVH